MNVIFICVIVLDKMCLHMLSLCWFKHKNIFECFSCFWKVFCFYKNWKFKKQCCPILATQLRVRQVVCHSRDLAAQFWWLVRKWKVQSWGVQREFRGSAHNSLAGRPSSHEKHLEIFFVNLILSVLAACPDSWLATYLSHENHVFNGLGVTSKSQNPLLHRFFTIALT